MRTKCLLLLAMLLLQACAVSNYLPALATDNTESFNVSIAFYPGKNGKQVQAPEIGLNIWLPGISGRLYGTADSEALLKAKPRSDDGSIYNIAVTPELLERLRQQAQDYQGEALQLSPSGARILRIAATVNHPYTGQSLGETYWFDARRKTPMLLLYSDRETHIQGQVEIEGETITHDIRLPGAGLYWVRQVKRFGNTSLTIAAKPEALQLAITAVE